jgi:hypothetical protein
MNKTQMLVKERFKQALLDFMVLIPDLESELDQAIKEVEQELLSPPVMPVKPSLRLVQ